MGAGPQTLAVKHVDASPEPLGPPPGSAGCAVEPRVAAERRSGSGPSSQKESKMDGLSRLHIAV